MQEIIDWPNEMQGLSHFSIQKFQGTPRYRFSRRTHTVHYFNLAVFFLAVPGTAKYGGNFLAVMKYGGTDFGGSRYCEIWR